MDNSKKKVIYEKLGAVWFQKIVFKVEEYKFKFIDKFCPNIGDWYSKQCDKKANKLCSKTLNEEEKKNIRFKYNCKKMRFKRELMEKKNRNYHINFNNASSFYNYLLWNKKVHMNGIISNLFSIVGCCVLLPLTSGFWFGAGCFYLGYNLLSLGVNFQCVNLQNYNICRFDEKKEILEKIEMRRKKSDAKNYALVGEKIYKQLETRVEVPKGEEIVKTLTTLEELEQLKKLALEIQRQQTQSSEKVNDLVKVNTKK